SRPHQHSAGTDSRRPVNVGEPDSRRAGYLPRSRPAAQLRDDLVDLTQSRSADGLSVGDTAAVGVDRERSADLRGAGGDQFLLLAVRTEPALGQVHDLRAALGVLE